MKILQLNLAASRNKNSTNSCFLKITYTKMRKCAPYLEIFKKASLSSKKFIKKNLNSNKRGISKQVFRVTARQMLYLSESMLTATHFCCYPIVINKELVKVFNFHICEWRHFDGQERVKNIETIFFKLFSYAHAKFWCLFTHLWIE